MQEQPGLVVLVIELENALAHMHTTVEPSKMWSPYREPLAKFLNKYTVEVAPYLHCFSGVAVLCILDVRWHKLRELSCTKARQKFVHPSRESYGADE